MASSVFPPTTFKLKGNLREGLQMLGSSPLSIFFFCEISTVLLNPCCVLSHVGDKKTLFLSQFKGL